MPQNTFRLRIQCWTIKYLPLMPHMRRHYQAHHLEKCLKMSELSEHRF